MANWLAITPGPANRESKAEPFDSGRPTQDPPPSTHPMSLTAATLVTSILFLVMGLALSIPSTAVLSMLKGFPRSTMASLVLLGAGTLGFLYRVAHLSPADFGDYRNFLLFAFATLAVLAYLREERGCEWDARVVAHAALRGHAHVVRWALARGAWSSSRRGYVKKCCRAVCVWGHHTRITGMAAAAVV